MTRESISEQNINPAGNQVYFDSVFTCEVCDHGLVRDCPKVKYTLLQRIYSFDDFRWNRRISTHRRQVTDEIPNT